MDRCRPAGRRSCRWKRSSACCKREWGYTQILLPDERTGFVATEDIQPAAPMGAAVSEDELFPNRQPSAEPLPVVEAPLPEPDLQLPVEDVPEEKPRKKQ